MDGLNSKTNNNHILYATINGQKVKIDIPEEGAIGLLAYGAVGLKAWRKVRIEAQNKRKEENDQIITEDEE